MTLQDTINNLVFVCHTASNNAGWWKDQDGVNTTNNPLTFSNKLMLIVSEVAEAMEGDRKNCKDDKLPHRDMREVELADALIRIADLAGAYEMDLGGAVVEKMDYNRTRKDHQKDSRAAEGGKKY
jgi:NTP pyrophosphatase (non-canonical NTP hydrolase)